MNDEIFNGSIEDFSKHDSWYDDSPDKFCDGNTVIEIPEIIYTDQYYKGIDFMKFEDVEQIDSSPSINNFGGINGNSQIFEIMRLPTCQITTVSVGKVQSPSGKKRPNFSPGVKKILNEWLMNNIKNPYPTKSEITVLEQKTGLTNKQIRVYLTNNRSRLLLRSPRKSEKAQRTLEISEDL